MPNKLGFGYYVYSNRNACDYCGQMADNHFLSSGSQEELSLLEWWEHHLDLCNDCLAKRRGNDPGKQN